MIILFRFFTLLLLLFYGSVVLKPGTKALAAVVPAISAEKRHDELIPWSESRRLTWDDFMCEPQHDVDAVALTSTALGISYRISNNQLSYQINCDFSKTKSWGLLKTPYILAHEQGHFDITEIFARKLNKALRHYHFNKRTFKQDINSIYDNIIKEKEAFQETYDSETNHSRNKRIQREWLDRIEEMLEETEPFANYP
jgi:hypothetical protein